MLFYPLYALLFAQSGLTAAQISSLFAIWCVVSFAFEVPSGAWADTFSRRRLLAFGALVRATGFLIWGVLPTYPGFAVGFACWAFCGAVNSGAKEALLYDALSDTGTEHRYTAIVARAETVAMLSMLAATALATPVLAIGGFGLITTGSVLACLGSAWAALRLPDRPVSTASSEAYWAALRAGLHEVRRDRAIRRAVVVAAAVPTLTSLDEYVSLLVHDLGVAVVGVPLAVAVMVAGMAAGSMLAERHSAARPRRIGLAVAGAGLALGIGAVSGSVWGLVPIAAGYGLLQLASVLTEARLQERMSGDARATVLSVSGLGVDIGALAVYASFGIGSHWFGTAQLTATFTVPILVVAVLAARWLPAHRAYAHSTSGPPVPPPPVPDRPSAPPP
ncbi:MFS transporter [Hamadaea sp. NPDC051192]|uniref:MFS transporter n=1 Tax=Hamadaea sp. NPDC051192 TaxID=3154940 RepID=UPI0034277985